MRSFKFISTSEAQTKDLAKRLGRGLKNNDCLALEGNFGSGKTTFVKGLIQGLGVRKKNYVCSPSFVILKIYRGRLPVYHFDLYRLSKPREFHDIGLDEFLDGGGISVIEWADKIRAFLPKGGLRIKFSILGRGKRGMHFSTADPRLGKLLRLIR